MTKYLMLAALLLTGAIAQAQAPASLFSEGFESGGQSAWSYVTPNGSTVSQECRTGRFCGAMQLTGGRDQQSIYWAKAVSYGGETFRASAWWRFPKGFSWNPGGQPWGLEHKMMIINTTNDVGRVLLNLRGDGESPEIAVHLERLDPYGPGQGISAKSGVRWPPDGAWHHFEIELQRRSGNQGRVQVWLDDRRVIDVTGRVCGSPCAAVRDVWFGAFSNQGAPRTQTFYLDDALIAATSKGPATTPTTPPQPPVPPSPTPDVQKALEAIARAQKELESALQALSKR